MSNVTKKILLHQVRQFKNSFCQFSHLPFSDVLSTETLEQIIAHSANSRDRIFTPLVTLKAFIFKCSVLTPPAGKPLIMFCQKGYTKDVLPTQ